MSENRRIKRPGSVNRVAEDEAVRSGHHQRHDQDGDDATDDRISNVFTNDGSNTLPVHARACLFAERVTTSIRRKLFTLRITHWEATITTARDKSNGTQTHRDRQAGSEFHLGQSHFIKTVEDLHEALRRPCGIKFRLAFCKSAGRRWCARRGRTSRWSSWRRTLALGAVTIPSLSDQATSDQRLEHGEDGSRSVPGILPTASPTQAIVAGRAGARHPGVIGGDKTKNVETGADGPPQGVCANRYKL
jgi:hypothetical protein